MIEALTNGDVTSPVLHELTPQLLGLAAEGIKEAFAHSFRVVYLVSIAFGVVGTVCVAFSSDVDHLMTKEVDIKLDEGTHVEGAVDTGEGHIIKLQD